MEEFISLDNVPDPNRDQNRIPLEAELETLRSIRTQKQKIVNNVASQLVESKEAHARIQARYQKLLQELDSTQSELNISRDYIDMLEAQHRVLRMDDERLAGLLHPIRRCPQDILRIIFQYVVETDQKRWFQRATTISHVCTSWRTIALGMSSLWTRLHISMEDNASDVISFMGRTRDRVRSTPVRVIISKVGERSPEDAKAFFECLNLNNFTSIECLHFSLTSSAGIRQLTPLIFGSQRALTESIWIKSVSDPPVNPSIAWDCSWILKHFSTTKTLHLDRIGVVTFGGSDPFPALQALFLSNIQVPSIAAHLARFPNLRELRVKGSNQLIPQMQNMRMLDLVILEVKKARGFSWSQLSAPKLATLITDDAHPGLMTFIRDHPTIRRFRYDVALLKETFKALSMNVPGVESLEIMGDIEGLFRKLDPDAPFPPFPRLKHLTTMLYDSYEPPCQDIEELLKARCLSNSASERGDIQLLSCWEMVGRFSALEHARWRSSPFLDGCQQKIRRLPNTDLWGSLRLEWTRQ